MHQATTEDCGHGFTSAVTLLPGLLNVAKGYGDALKPLLYIALMVVYIAIEQMQTIDVLFFTLALTADPKIRLLLACNIKRWL